jgi:hypothetical protein
MNETELIRDLMELAINTHPLPKSFRESLDSGYCERMLKVIGPEVFDPNKRVRLVLAARAYLVEQAVEVAK